MRVFILLYGSNDMTMFEFEWENTLSDVKAAILRWKDLAATPPDWVVLSLFDVLSTAPSETQFVRNMTLKEAVKRLREVGI